MADRNVVVRLRAEIADFKRGMDEAAKATEKVGQNAKKSTEQSKTASGQFVDAMNKSRDSFDAVANRALVVGGAMTAVTGIVLKTGISYNTLQQTSRAAMTTLLGGAEAANAQMDKLDEFARSSPFSKQVFITAQQQLIGFGMAAERVLPTLDAVQNAVAAVGGSNQDISELTYIIAQVGAAGKITATDLMQFGQRGVDAATLIGSQMGKTGAQIREEITAGTLGADDAIRALTDGMQERFGGAAANVKNTFTGAMDRVKAALRDISSEFASAFIDPSGGGMLIDWTNSLADLLRGFQALPGPVKTTTGTLFALTGVTALTTGAILKTSGAVFDLYDNYRKLNTTAPLVVSGMNKVAAAAAVVGLAFTIKQMETWRRTAKYTGIESADVARGLEDIASGARSAGTGLDGLDEIFRRGGLRGETFVTTADAMERFGRTAEVALGTSWSARIDRFEAFGSSMAVLEEQVGVLDAGLSDLVSRGKIEEAAEAFEMFMGAVDPAIADQVREMFVGYETALAEIGPAAGEAAGGLAELAEETDEIGGKFLELADAALAASNAVLGLAGSEINLEAAFDSATAAVKENGATLDITTDKGRKNKTELIGLAGAAIKVAEDMFTAGKSTSDVNVVMDDARRKFIEVADKMGLSATEAAAMADEYGLTRESVNNLSKAIQDVPSQKEVAIRADISQALGAVGVIKTQIRGLNGRTIDVNVRTVYTSIGTPGALSMSTRGGYTRADGGISEWRNGRHVDAAFASGGMFDGRIGAQQPQVRPYAGPRGLLWSEEGSGPWEAFISGHPAKRDRSMRIWLDVGRRLGAIAAHAEGGLREYAQAPAVRFSAATSQRSGASVLINNYYPINEPTSVATERALQTASAVGLGG